METKNIQRSLGKRAPLTERARLAFSDFLTAIPEHPLMDIAPRLDYPMDGNDTVGDCVCAGWDHLRQVVTYATGGVGKNFTQAQLWDFYRTQNPNFDPNGGSKNGPGSSADNGMIIQTFLEYLQKNGYIVGFAAVNWRDLEQLKAAIYVGLGVITGVQLQQAQEGAQFSQGLWDYVKGSPTVGGHCIPVPGYQTSVGEAVSWAKIVGLTPTFIANQMDECWIVILPEHLEHTEIHNFVDVAAFIAAVKAITGKDINVPNLPTNNGYVFTKTEKHGYSGNEVMELQKRLAKEVAADGKPCFRYAPNGTDPQFTTYFGYETQKAVQRYQCVKGIVCAGNAEVPATAAITDSTGFGQTGPATRATLNGSAVKRSLVDAMIQVESGGDDNAIGDKTLVDHAYGCLQIRQGVVDQVNAKLKTAYKSQDCLGNRSLSLLIFNTYWTVFTALVTDEDRAKAWNGGPAWKNIYGKPGYETYSANIDAYWKKVQAAQGV